MATGACEIAAALQQIEATIKDFERKACDGTHEQDPAFQKEWDQAVQKWWELAERFQALDGADHGPDHGPDHGTGMMMAQQFIEDFPIQADFMT